MDINQERICRLADQLVKTVKASDDFNKTKEAVVAFIEGMDTQAHVVGDTDLAVIAARALKRRGKAIDTFPAMVQAGEAGAAAKAGK